MIENISLRLSAGPSIAHRGSRISKNEGRYPFSTDARPYRTILELIADYQIHIGKPLKFR